MARCLIKREEKFTGFIYAEFVNSNIFVCMKEGPFVEFSTASIWAITRCYLQRIHEGCMLDEAKCAWVCLLHWHYIFECVETVSAYVPVSNRNVWSRKTWSKGACSQDGRPCFSGRRDVRDGFERHNPPPPWMPTWQQPELWHIIMLMRETASHSVFALPYDER